MVDRDDVVVLDPAEVFDDPVEASISSTEVRRRVRDGQSVEALVPPGVARRLQE
jgi:nicotinic acid mononucleotide adenylyltransferase